MQHPPSAHAINTLVWNFEETGSSRKKKYFYWRCVNCLYTKQYRDFLSGCHKKPTSFNLSSCSVSTVPSFECSKNIVTGLSLPSIQVADRPGTQTQRSPNATTILWTNAWKDNEFISNLWMSDEAHFHLNGFVNKQNVHYWAQQNPTEVHQRPLHRQGYRVLWCVTVWCNMLLFFWEWGGFLTTVR